MPRTAIISVDGHVKASRKGYRDYVDPDLRDDYDDYVKGLKDYGMPDGGNVRPEYGRGEHGGADQRVETDGRHFTRLQRFVDELERDRPDQQPAPNAITIAMTFTLGVVT